MSVHSLICGPEGIVILRTLCFSVWPRRSFPHIIVWEENSGSHTDQKALHIDIERLW